MTKILEFQSKIERIQKRRFGWIKRSFLILFYWLTFLNLCINVQLNAITKKHNYHIQKIQIRGMCTNNCCITFPHILFCFENKKLPFLCQIFSTQTILSAYTDRISYSSFVTFNTYLNNSSQKRGSKISCTILFTKVDFFNLIKNDVTEDGNKLIIYLDKADRGHPVLALMIKVLVEVKLFI